MKNTFFLKDHRHQVLITLLLKLEVIDVMTIMLWDPQANGHIGQEVLRVTFLNKPKDEVRLEF